MMVVVIVGIFSQLADIENWMLSVTILDPTLPFVASAVP